MPGVRLGHGPCYRGVSGAVLPARPWLTASSPIPFSHSLRYPVTGAPPALFISLGQSLETGKKPSRKWGFPVKTGTNEIVLMKRRFARRLVSIGGYRVLLAPCAGVRGLNGRSTRIDTQIRVSGGDEVTEYAALLEWLTGEAGPWPAGARPLSGPRPVRASWAGCSTCWPSPWDRAGAVVTFGQ